MSQIRELLNNREVFLVTTANTAEQAGRYMLEKNVSALPVVSEGHLVGVLSERDLVRRVLMHRRDWSTTSVGDIMTPDPLTVSSKDDLHECMVLMKRHGFRHLPVCDDGQLVGFLSLRDLLLHEIDEKEVEVRMMRVYMGAE